MLGIISDSDFEQELAKLNGKKAPAPKVVPIDIGRGSAKENPDSLRKVVAEDALAGAPAKVLAEAYGISPSSVSAYKVGASSTSTYNEPKKDLKQYIDGVRDKITKRASRKLVKALDAIDESFDGVSARDKMAIAKDASVIIKNMQPEAPSAIAQANVQFVVHAPKMKDEKDWDVIDVND